MTDAVSSPVQPSSLLQANEVCAGWGDNEVISNISFALRSGEALAILGRNGVGKTTLLSTVAGRATLRSGEITLLGQSLSKMPRYSRALAGIGLVPQEREIFPSLTVEENLTVAAKPGRRDGLEQREPWTLEKVYDIFPRLRERRSNWGNQLSGGEQQMLSIGRALMGNPSVLLLDEPTEGLAPVIVDQLIAALIRIREETHLALLLVEQHVSVALAVTNKLLVLDRGVVVFQNMDEFNVVRQEYIESLVGVVGTPAA